MADTTASSRDFAADSALLANPQTDTASKVLLATTLRDTIDSYTASDILIFTTTLLPAILQLIQTGKPCFIKDAPEQQLRHTLLDTLHRMPPHEQARTLAPDIMNAAIYIITHDNEDNAILGVKIAVDMYRTHKSALDVPAQSFINTIHTMYDGMSDLVRETLDGDTEMSVASGGSTSKAGESGTTIPNGMRSFRVMAECPIATIVIGQNHLQLVSPAIQFLQLEASMQKRAHEEAEAKGETHLGVSPYIKNKAAYASFVTAQIKTMSLLAYLMRLPAPQEAIRQHQELFPRLCVRLLQDIPLDAPGMRKEMGIAIRHMVTTDFRSAFFPFLDRLLDERLLVGTGLTGQEQLRPFAYSTLADLVHYLRAELTPAQLKRVVFIYSCHLHDPSLSPGIHNMCSKVLVALHECISKLEPAENGPLLTGLLECYVSKLHAVHILFLDLVALRKATALEKEKPAIEVAPEGEAPDAPVDLPYIPPEIFSTEKQKPIQRTSYVVESNEETLKESRALFRTLLHGIRGSIVMLRKFNGPIPDSEILGRFFEGAFKCLSLWSSATETREEKEVVDWFGGVFHEFQPHVFQEVWTLKMDFFIGVALEHPFALQVANGLMAHQELSRQLTSVMLRHLVDRLDTLGDQDSRSANVTLRLFKMVFMSVNLLPEANEAVLAPHLTRLIMDSFPLAAKAREPTSYFLLIRALFRSISGGKFDRVYNEILPLLSELLETLNRLIIHAEGPTRDLLVELCLTVPVRLTHLLPYLQFLMRPLVLALRGSAEMAAQGLRTLELCIDNLTQDFLEPCFAPVRRELMGALYDLLRPLPASHLLSHACIRILGKLGGRNRRLQYNHPLLEYQPCAEEASLLLSFDGRSKSVNMGPMATLATKAVRYPNAAYRKSAFDVLRHICGVFLQEGAQGRERENIFTLAVEGLFDAIHVPDLKVDATNFIRDLSKHIFTTELLKTDPGPASSRRYPMSPLATIFVEWLPRGLAWNEKEEQATAESVVRLIIEDLAAIGPSDTSQEAGRTPREPSGILHNLASAFVGMCHDESWGKKMAGCRGITILVSTDSLPSKMILDREFDFVRALISVLKDMPVDPPRDVDEVTKALIDVIKKADTAPAGEDGVPLHRSRMGFLIGILHIELASSNSVVRKATQDCIRLLSEISERTPTELLLPHRERLLLPIYTKPLRALSFATQIGHIDAVTYCLGLQPPLPEASEELMRLLSEALALADADDQNLLGRVYHRQNTLALNRLRVACIKLLTASMPVTDLFLRQPPVRQRAISVYFKSLYSSSVEVKNAAHDGLRVVLIHQTRLPKEQLQTGLRPILMNLADPKRISVSGLDGLARLLELLTHYFKPEIGTKLLEHYSSIADATVLHEAALSPLASNDDICKLVKLVNIFHLLPAAANMYLDSLANVVVDTEAQLHAAAPTPFSEPFGKFVDRYASDGVRYFMQRIQSPRHVQTLRNVILSGTASNFREELFKAVQLKVEEPSYQDNSQTLPFLLLLVCRDLVEQVPSWLDESNEVLTVLRQFWRRALNDLVTLSPSQPDDLVRTISVLLLTFKAFLEHSMRMDVLFEVVAIFAVSIPIDLTQLLHFIYYNVAAVESIALKQEALSSFMDAFESSEISWTQKTQLLSTIINPMLSAALLRKDLNESLLEGDFLERVHTSVWQPMAVSADAFAGADDGLRIQLLSLSSSVIQLAPSIPNNIQKDIVKCGWNFINADDMFLRQMAHLLTARFFEAFEAPPKFLLKVWQGLLRPLKETERNVEDRHLTRIALDVLAPIMLKRIEGDSWIRQTRFLLHEEGHTVSALVHIYQVVVGHPDVFYECRDFLVPQMAISLQKIGLNTAVNSADTRTLSLDVVDLILAWDKRERKGMDNEMDTSEDGVAKTSNWSIPLNIRENVISYILRFITSIPTDTSGTRSSLASRALEILEYLLGPEGWPEVTVKISFFNKVFAQLEFKEPGNSLALNNAKALAIVLKDKDQLYFASNASVILRLLEEPMAGNDNDLHDTLGPVFMRLLQAVPMPNDETPSDDVSRALYTFVENTVNEGLKAQHSNVAGTLAVLHCLITVQPSKLETFGKALMAVLTRLTKEYTQTPPVANPETLVPLIRTILETCRSHVGYLADSRQFLLKAFFQLVDKSQNIGLSRYLLEVVQDWTINRKDAMYPTLKEKASILQRMYGFMREEALGNELLALVYQIYTDPGLRRSELTIRLESMFLLGCRAKDPLLRMQFVDLYDESLPKGLGNRLQFVLGSSSWDTLGDQYWISQALDLLFGAVQDDLPLLPTLETDRGSTAFAESVSRAKVKDLLRPVRMLLHLNPQATHDLWVSTFKAIWSTLTRREQQDVTRSTIALLSKDYHFRQVDSRINVIQSFLAAIHACSPPMSLPPYLIKYLGKTFNAWHIALEILQTSLESYREEETTRDATYDALAEIYAELSEEDMFYGLWRRRSLFPDTNVAISFEQAGMFSVAQSQHEIAQIKARSGNMPFNEAEYCVWEDHWILCTQKLQQWDVLMDLGRYEDNHDLLLECAWRTVDWNTEREMIDRALSSIVDVPTPRRRIFEAYTALVKSHLAGNGDRGDFIRLSDEAMQLSLRKWASLPPTVSMAHVPLLQHFQQVVELHEASAIFTALQMTNAANLEKRSGELKGVLQAWRERLPNLWDDISIWSDVVAWRQHVFTAINNTYLPLIPQVPQINPQAGGNTTFGYRGYHETAWIINRFAHVARKHHLMDVCHTFLTKIYTLPNIEISEAFLKLREQARCHYQNPNELHAGLEVINNTNLMYFTNSQKAEFFTLKGMFIAKLGHNEEANAAFGQAVQTELALPKAWAEWGRYNDRLFRDTPTDISLAANAVSCYLQAAGMYKSAKTRPLIVRILWLLSNDDNVATVARAFENYKGDIALWYWITVIPQLLLSLTYRETPHAKNMLINLAKNYPQALFFHLRTLREDLAPARKKYTAAMAAAQAEAAAKAAEASGPSGTDASMEPTSPQQGQADAAAASTANATGGKNGVAAAGQSPLPRGPRHSWEHVEEIVAVLKTAFPLLALTMETMVDQFAQRFKATQEEELVRYFNALLMEALQCHSIAVTTNTGPEEIPLPQQCIETASRFAESALQGDTRADFKADVIDPKPSLREYIGKLQRWRDRYEKVLEARPRLQPLDVLSHWLVEFQHSKFDEVEVPGQYLEHKDSNTNFVRIARFASQYELCHGMGFSYRRITIMGHDGTKHSFIVQLPTSRNCRREEKLHQMFRIFSSVLVRRKETRKRVLSFHLPAAIPLNPGLRLLENDSSVVGLQDIYDQHLRELGLNKEDPVILHAEKFRNLLDLHHSSNGNKTVEKQEYMNLRLELFEVVSTKMVPNTILSSYMTRSMPTANALWLLRKQFTTQMAAVTFMSYVLNCITRTPSRYHISRSTGLVYMSDFVPGYRHNVTPLSLGTNEAVPFRFTPNFQQFIGNIGMEGLMAAGIMAIGRTLTEPEFDLEQHIGLFIKDEIIAWHQLNQKALANDQALRDTVAAIVDQIVKKAELMSCRNEREGTANLASNQSYTTTAVQSVVTLISSATNPQLLSRMAEQWLPWL